MLTEGTVLKVDDEYAIIGVKRHSACDTCRAQCGGHCDKADTVETKVRNTLGVSVGDKVRLYSKTSTIMGYALLVFVVPLIVGMLGYAIPYFLNASVVICAVCSALGFILSFVLIWILYKDKKGYETIELYEITEKYNDGI